MRRGALPALAAIPLLVSSLPAQAVRYPLGLAGAGFVETVHSDVTTQSGTASRHRTISRWARYSTSLRADTLVVTGDSLELEETIEGVRRAVDVDAVIGGRWKLLAEARGRVVVVDTPFVPGAVAEVSDLGAAMDDFFPPEPPSIAAGSQLDDSGHSWRRLSDSSAIRRYHWSGRRHSDSTSIGADSVAVHAVIDAHEEGDLAWSPARGPMAWVRRIQTTLTSRFSGRTVRADVDQRIAVVRVQPH